MSRIAIVGSGISGLVCAWLLHRRHEITVLEAADHIGGHTHTVAVDTDAGRFDVDTGFVVFNTTTYPNFVALLERLGVASREAEMSFSVSCARTGLEYRGSSLNTLFAQRRNLLRLGFYRMLADVARFNREARRALGNGGLRGTLGKFLEGRRYSREFVDHYIVPMGAAIWSSGAARMLDFPAQAFARFFENHGLLGLNGHLQWRTVTGGSARYVDAMVEPIRDRIHTGTPVRRVRRSGRGVEIATDDATARFDEVILATHGDTTLQLLDHPTANEREILGAFEYQPNDAVLHTDTAVLPRNRRAWASWNYQIPAEEQPRVAVTYNMNRLQGLDAPETFCVTLNRTEEIDPARVIRRIRFTHPVFDAGTLEAQQRHHEISGVDRLHYCGAYWGNGFHEDGVNSALSVCRSFGASLT